MKKTPGKNGKVTVTFELPPDVEASEVAVCGDFNDWTPDKHLMKRRKDGSFSVSVRLEPGSYRFRYLLDGTEWENDWAPDAYAPNEYGSDDSVVTV